MDAHTSQILSGLPADLETSDRRALDLEGLLGRLAHKPVPVGRWQRFWILGTLQARIAAAYLAHWLRAGFAGADRREASLNEARLTAALQLLGGMGYLRGAVMKLGQTLAHWPEVAPVPFSEVLGLLHFEAPPMHFALLRELVLDELGADPAELFAEFDTQAFAAASLGQVHKARLQDGRAVAVKIQYPGMARSIHADAENFQLLMQPMRLGRHWANMMAMTEDIRAMLDLEMDYRHEAGLQDQARAVLADADDLVVPEVHHAVSTGRVLTSDLLEGVHLDAWLASGPGEAERTRRAEQLLRASFRLWYSGSLVYADPHPGNYLFLPDGRLGLLDFGSVRRLSPEELAYSEQAGRCLDGQSDELDAFIARSTAVDSIGDLSPAHAAYVREFCDWVWEPLRHDGPFDFAGGGYFERGAALMGQVFRKRYTRSHPVNTWFNRNFFGVRALLHRMGARVDMRAIHLEERARADG